MIPLFLRWYTPHESMPYALVSVKRLAPEPGCKGDDDCCGEGSSEAEPAPRGVLVEDQQCGK